MMDQKEFKTSQSPATTATDSLTLRRLFLTWFRIGCTSFGGGAVTQYQIQENFIYKHHWITEAEFANIIAMCQIAPGINIFAYTILIGKRLAGWRGIIISLLGLIVPSAVITIGITAIFASIRDNARVQSALQTMFAAIFGISLATNWRNAKPIVSSNRRRGSFSFGVTLGIIIGSALIYVFFNPPVVVLYLLGGLCGALAYWHVAKRQPQQQQED